MSVHLSLTQFFISVGDSGKAAVEEFLVNSAKGETGAIMHEKAAGNVSGNVTLIFGGVDFDSHNFRQICMKKYKIEQKEKKEATPKEENKLHKSI